MIFFNRDSKKSKDSPVFLSLLLFRLSFPATDSVLPQPVSQRGLFHVKLTFASPFFLIVFSLFHLLFYFLSHFQHFLMIF